MPNEQMVRERHPDSAKAEEGTLHELLKDKKYLVFAFASILLVNIRLISLNTIVFVT